MTTRTPEHICADIMQYCEDKTRAIKIDDALAVALVFVEEARRVNDSLKGEAADLRDRIAHLEKDRADFIMEAIKKET